MPWSSPAAVTARLLEAFLTACAVPDSEKRAPLAARDRVENPRVGLYPCAAVERAHERLQDERVRLRHRGEILPDEEDSSDGYEEMLRHRRPDPALMTDEELEALQAVSEARAQEGEDCRAQLTSCRDPQ
ncbi:hypothetical protein FHS35_009244 [Streptomyces umbrinus]|uniref:hypothetical protein n=1 Tax=Streptomyces umbrinus TaxID=67370 RepID=UPI00167D1E66|nr:hypothetical protein [Streptomyces umbrinus]MCR3732326.1 hypothetical protein [Streptomyces umbrinus]